MIKGIRVIQLNCQNAYGVMCDLGNVMREKRVSVLLLQEPYISNGSVCGLPSGTRAYMKDGGGKVMIVVNDNKVDAMSVMGCMEKHGVCVWIKVGKQEMYLCSVYCQFNALLSL